MYRKILAPHDGFSCSSENAVEHAIKLGKLLNSQVIFLHVIPGTFFDPTIIRRRALQKKSCSISDVIKDTYKEIEERVASMFNEKKQRCDAIGISSSIQILVGHPEDKILEIAREEKVDLIVMGNTGLKGISKIRALGSVARRISEKAPCPILLVH